MDIYSKLKELNIDVPKPVPAGNYSLAVVSNRLVYTSGQTPKLNGKLIKEGKVGKDLTLEDGYDMARQCTINALGCIEYAIGDLNKIKKVVKAVAFINSAPGFTSQAKVANGCTDLLVKIFGDENGKPARSAVGMFELPGNAPCEVELIVEI